MGLNQLPTQPESNTVANTETLCTELLHRSTLDLRHSLGIKKNDGSWSCVQSRPDSLRKCFKNIQRCFYHRSASTSVTNPDWLTIRHLHWTASCQRCLHSSACVCSGFCEKHWSYIDELWSKWISYRLKFVQAGSANVKSSWVICSEKRLLFSKAFFSLSQLHSTSHLHSINDRSALSCCEAQRQYLGNSFELYGARTSTNWSVLSLTFLPRGQRYDYATMPMPHELIRTCNIKTDQTNELVLLKERIYTLKYPLEMRSVDCEQQGRVSSKTHVAFHIYCLIWNRTRFLPLFPCSQTKASTIGSRVWWNFPGASVRFQKTWRDQEPFWMEKSVVENGWYFSKQERSFAILPLPPWLGIFGPMWPSLPWRSKRNIWILNTVSTSPKQRLNSNKSNDM